MYRVEYSYIARGDTQPVTGVMYCQAEREPQAYTTARVALSAQRKTGMIKGFSIISVTKES
jgi:hypothetical protein